VKLNPVTVALVLSFSPTKGIIKKLLSGLFSFFSLVLSGCLSPFFSSALEVKE
jgi:hypothetical protein